MKPGSVRIIAGCFRGRRLPIQDLPGLRPTTDRIRETLFNWLAPYLPGAHCLDVCSGTGIFAFESLSRGAAEVILIDNNPHVVQQLQQQKKQFEVSNAHIICADALQWLAKPASHTFDIVFIDPPFHLHILPLICEQLSQNHWLNPEAHIYLEMPKSEQITLPSQWQCLKHQQAGNTHFGLWMNSYEL